MGGKIDSAASRRRHWKTTHPDFSLRHKTIKLIAMQPNLTIRQLKKHLPALMERCTFEFGMTRDETVAWIAKHYRTPVFMVAEEINRWQRMSKEERRKIYM